MAQTNYGFTFWHANYTYTKWDVAYGAYEDDPRPIYYYSLRDANLNTGPLARFVYTATSSTRTDDVNRIYFTQTGTTYFLPGSPVEIAGIQPDASVIHSGICLAAGSGYVDYLSPGLSVTNGVTNGTVTAPIHPYWTTGFAWIPSWTTEVTHTPSVLTAQLGEGYSQRSNPTLNANTLRWNLVFSDRPDKEARALLNFLQDHGGAGFFHIPFPIGLLYNRPDLKYVNGQARHQLTSYGLSTVSCEVQQIFDL